MADDELKNKPLVEAIFELRWQLQAVGEKKGKGDIEQASDPNYKILLARLFEKFIAEYPAPETLATASLPDEMVPYLVQHRFRAAKDAWPLVQVGSGVFSVNDTDGYKWERFLPRCKKAIDQFMESYPVKEDFKPKELILRYIDAIAFDPEKENPFQFVKEKLKTTVSFPEAILDDGKVEKDPSSISWQLGFPTKEPVGTITLKIVSGKKDGNPAIVLDTTVVSKGEQIPKLPDGLTQWLEAAHAISHKWFFSLIKGELEKRFRREKAEKE